METVSIIIPVFNGEVYLSDCLNSLLAQTFQDFRVYLIDDGSTDGTAEICQNYSARDGRVHYIRQENRGVSAARNRGMELAKGEFVTFCDGDDFWKPTHLETLLRAAAESGADMVSCNYDHVDCRGDFLRRTEFPAGIQDLVTPAGQANYIQDVLNWRTGWAVWARLFRRESVENLRFCEEISFGEDLLFVLEAALFCRRTAAISEGGYCYRQHGASATATVENRPMLESRAAGAYWFWRRHSGLDVHIFWEILRPGLENTPAKQLPGAMKALPQYPWIREIACLIDSPLARFCVHGNVLRYRMEKKFQL